MWHKLIFLPVHLFIFVLIYPLISADFIHLCSHLVSIHYLYFSSQLLRWLWHYCGDKICPQTDKQIDGRGENNTSCSRVNGNDWNWVTVMCYLKQMWANGSVTTSCLASSGTLAWTDGHINIWPDNLNLLQCYFMWDKGVSRSTFCQSENITRWQKYLSEEPEVHHWLLRVWKSEKLNLCYFWCPEGGDSTGFKKTSDWI